MRELHGWRRAARLMIGIGGSLVGLVALVFVVAWIVFQTGWGRGVLERQIEARLDKTFVGGARIGSVEGNPLSELVLRDVVINGPDKQPAVIVKRLTVELPLLPLLSHQLRVDTIIAEDVDVRATLLANGEINLAHLTKPSAPSTWNVALPNVEVHRGHLRVEGAGDEPIDVDHLEVFVDAKLPFAGPIDANARVTGVWRQKRAPISIGAVVHSDHEALEVRNAGIQVGDVRVVALGVKLPKGAFATPLSGSVALQAPAKTVHELVPSVTLPADIALSVNARAEGRRTQFSVLGAIGTADVSAFGSVDVQAKLASIVVSATDLDLGKLTNGKLAGRGGGLATLQLDGSTRAELPTAAGVITAWSTIEDGPPLDVAIAFDSLGDRVRATVGAASSGGFRAGASGSLRKHGERIDLEGGDLIASTLDVQRTTAGNAPLHGMLSAKLHAAGRLAPELDLAITGRANGRNLRMAGARADRLALRIDATHVPFHPIGTARVELSDVERGDLKLAKLVLAAGTRPDGRLQLTLRSQPKPAPWQVDVDALITPGDTVVVELQRHFVRAAGGSTWRGTTGRLTVAPRAIELHDLRSTSDNGVLSADATYVRAGRDQGDLAARVDASVELGDLMNDYKGHVDAHVDIKRSDGRFTGTVVANAKGVRLDPQSPVAFDGDVKVEARNKQLLANVDVATAKSGCAKLALDVDAPQDVTNVRAWRTLGRDAIRSAQLTLRGVQLQDVAKLAHVAPMIGRVDGSVELSPAHASGALQIRGVQLPRTRDLGSIDADLKVAQGKTGELSTTLSAWLVPTPNAVAAKDLAKNGQPRLELTASFATPDRIFNPTAWQRLGAMAFRGATLKAERLAFEPGTLERLGIVSPLRGELAVGAEIAPGLEEVRFSVNLHQLRGGLLAQPVAINVVGAVDDQSTRVGVDVRAQGVTLVHVGSELPVTLDQLRTNPAGAKSAALTGEARIDRVPAKVLMNVLGTGQISGGTLDGAIKLGGTVDRPTIDAKLVAQDVTVPSEGSVGAQQIRQLSIAARWDGAAGDVAIDGSETGGGKLEIRAAGSPADVDKISASIYADKLDIAPLVAFMPGPAGGLAGRMDADFKLRGANPRTAQLAGTMHITNGRIPIAPNVGTLFEGDVRIAVTNQTLGLAMSGKLGRGGVVATATVPLEGFTPKNGKLQITVRDVQLIGTTEPILTGVIDADIARIANTWRSNVRVTHMTVKVPAQKGRKLSPVGAPKDLVYGGEKLHHGKPRGRDVPQGQHGKPPTAPAFVADVELKHVTVESNEVHGLVGGKLTVSVADNREIGVVGDIGLSRGVLELFSRRYDVDKAALHFDGSLDPVLDVRITYDFPEVTTTTEVRGRMSKPQLTLSSEPGRYTQAELLGFLLGGEPGGDPNKAPSASERVAGPGASIIGNQVGGYVKRALPVDVDVLRYEAATSTTSAAVTVGTWITDTLFLAYRRHLEARPDENAGQGEIEYWIRRRLVVEGVIGDRGVSSADLLWRRRW